MNQLSISSIVLILDTEETGTGDLQVRISLGKETSASSWSRIDMEGQVTWSENINISCNDNTLVEKNLSFQLMSKRFLGNKVLYSGTLSNLDNLFILRNENISNTVNLFGNNKQQVGMLILQAKYIDNNASQPSSPSKQLLVSNSAKGAELKQFLESPQAKNAFESEEEDDESDNDNTTSTNEINDSGVNKKSPEEILTFLENENVNVNVNKSKIPESDNNEERKSLKERVAQSQRTTKRNSSTKMNVAINDNNSVDNSSTVNKSHLPPTTVPLDSPQSRTPMKPRLSNRWQKSLDKVNSTPPIVETKEIVSNEISNVKDSSDILRSSENDRDQPVRSPPPKQTTTVEEKSNIVAPPKPVTKIEDQPVRSNPPTPKPVTIEDDQPVQLPPPKSVTLTEDEPVRSPPPKSLTSTTIKDQPVRSNPPTPKPLTVTTEEQPVRSPPPKSVTVTIEEQPVQSSLPPKPVTTTEDQPVRSNPPTPKPATVVTIEDQPVQSPLPPKAVTTIEDQPVRSPPPPKPVTTIEEQPVRSPPPPKPATVTIKDQPVRSPLPPKAVTTIEEQPVRSPLPPKAVTTIEEQPVRLPPPKPLTVIIEDQPVRSPPPTPKPLTVTTEDQPVRPPPPTPKPVTVTIDDQSIQPPPPPKSVTVKEDQPVRPPPPPKQVITQVTSQLEDDNYTPTSLNPMIAKQINVVNENTAYSSSMPTASNEAIININTSIPSRTSNASPIVNDESMKEKSYIMENDSVPFLCNQSSIGDSPVNIRYSSKRISAPIPPPPIVPIIPIENSVPNDLQNEKNIGSSNSNKSLSISASSVIMGKEIIKSEYHNYDIGTKDNLQEENKIKSLSDVLQGESVSLVPDDLMVQKLESSNEKTESPSDTYSGGPYISSTRSSHSIDSLLRGYIKVGFINKLAKVSGRNWKKRFLTLNSFNLSYFNEEPNFIKSTTVIKNFNDTNPKGEVQLTPKSKIIEDGYDDAYGFKFKFSNDSESIVFAVSTQSERDSWLDSIKFAIDDCQSFIKGNLTVTANADQRSSSLSKSMSGFLSSGKSKKYFILSHNILSCHPNEAKTSKVESLININNETIIDFMDDVTYTMCLIDNDYTLTKLTLQFDASEYKVWKKHLLAKIDPSGGLYAAKPGEISSSIFRTSNTNSSSNANNSTAPISGNSSSPQKQSQFQSQPKGSSGKLENLKQLLSDEKEKNSQQNNEITLLKKTLNETEKKSFQDASEIKKLIGINGNLTTENDLLNNKLKDMEESLDLLNGDIFEKESICEELKNMIDDFVNKIKSCEEEIDNLKSEILKSDEQHHLSLNDQKIRSDSANFRVVELENKIKELEVGTVTTINETPPTRRNSSILSVDNSASDIKKYLTTISKKDEEITNLSNEVNLKEDQVFRLESHIALLNEQLDEARRESSRLNLVVEEHKQKEQSYNNSPLNSPIRNEISFHSSPIRNNLSINSFPNNLFKSSFVEEKGLGNQSIISNNVNNTLSPPSMELLKRSRISKGRVSQGSDPRDLAFHRNSINLATNNELSSDIVPLETRKPGREEMIPIKRSLSNISVFDSSLNETSNGKTLPHLLDLSSSPKSPILVANTFNTNISYSESDNLKLSAESKKSRLSLSDLNSDKNVNRESKVFSEPKENVRNSIDNCIPSPAMTSKLDMKLATELNDKFLRSTITLQDKNRDERNARFNDSSVSRLVKLSHFFPLELTQSDYVKRIFYITGNGIRSCILRTFQIVQLTFIPNHLAQSQQNSPRTPVGKMMNSSSMFNSVKLYNEFSDVLPESPTSTKSNYIFTKLVSKTEYYDSKSLMDLLLLNNIQHSPVNNILKKSIHQEVSKILRIENMENILNSARHLVSYYEKSLNSFEMDNSGKLVAISDLFDAARYLIINLGDKDLREFENKSPSNTFRDNYNDSYFTEGKNALTELSQLSEQMEFHLLYKNTRMDSKNWRWEALTTNAETVSESSSLKRSIDIDIRTESIDLRTESIDNLTRFVNEETEISIDVAEYTQVDINKLVIEFEGVSAKMLLMTSPKITNFLFLFLRLSFIKEVFDEIKRNSRESLSKDDYIYVNKFITAIDAQLELDISSEMSHSELNTFQSPEDPNETKKYREVIKSLEEIYLSESSNNLLALSPDHPKNRLSEKSLDATKTGKSLIYNLKYLIQKSKLLSREIISLNIDKKINSSDSSKNPSIDRIESLIKQNKSLLDTVSKLFIRPPELVSLNKTEIKSVLLQLSSYQHVSDMMYNATLTIKNNDHVSIGSMIINTRSSLILNSIYLTWPNLRVMSDLKKTLSNSLGLGGKKKSTSCDLVYASDINLTEYSIDFSDVKRLKSIGFTVSHLLETKFFDIKQILSAGYSSIELRKLKELVTLSINDLRLAGYSVSQCVSLGFDAITIQAGGYSDFELYQSNSFSAKHLKKIGCDIQKLILISLYDNLEGKYWKNNSNWCTSKPISEWHGVYLDSLGMIIKIDLRSNFLKGVLPESLSLLSSLQYLDLYNNHISGTVPDSFKKLTELKDLWLNNNTISTSRNELKVTLPNCRIRI